MIWRLFAAGWLGMSVGTLAADTPGPSLTWQVSRTTGNLLLQWSDPAGIRAVVETSTDLTTWGEYQGGGVYSPGLTSAVFEAYIDRGVRPPWGVPWSLERTRAYRIRRITAREGRVMFANRNTAAGIDAPVRFSGPSPPTFQFWQEGLAAGSYFFAQLHVEAPGLYAGPVGSPVPFRTGGAAGFIVPHEVVVPMSEATDEVQVKMVAWPSALGSTFNEAWLTYSYGGMSRSFVVEPTKNMAEAAAPLVGLETFVISAPLGWPLP